jgi:hypothetical protein
MAEPASGAALAENVAYLRKNNRKAMAKPCAAAVASCYSCLAFSLRSTIILFNIEVRRRNGVLGTALPPMAMRAASSSNCPLPAQSCPRCAELTGPIGVLSVMAMFRQLRTGGVLKAY